MWGPLIVISALSIVIALVVWFAMGRGATLDEQISIALQREDFESAERLAWSSLQSNPNDLAQWIRFVDIDASMTGAENEDSPSPPVSPASVRKLITTIRDPRGRTIVAYWYDTRAGAMEPNAAPVIALADSNRPPEFANYVLARVALRHKDWHTAATRFEREGRRRDLRRAIAIWIDHDAWNEVRRRLHDPRYDSVLDAALRLDIASTTRRVRILKWIWPGLRQSGVWPIPLQVSRRFSGS
jgi:hypothetical protein